MSASLDALDPCRKDLATKLASAFHALWPQTTDAWPAVALAALLEKPPDLALGDFAFPCFRFAKDLKLKPQDIAAQIADRLNGTAGGWLKSASVAAAFVNIKIDRNLFASTLIPPILSGKHFESLKNNEKRCSTRVMVEYSQPNTHKEFHVGHVRNIALGGCLVHLFRACGYPTQAVNYFGDEGTHIAKCLWLVRSRMSEVPAKNKGEWLSLMYAEANRLLKEATPEEKAVQDQEISAILREIEHKSGPMYKLWKETRQWSLDEFKDIYAFLDSPFDHDFFESQVSEESQKIVDEFVAKGVFIHSEGAIGLDLKAEKLGFLLLRKRDGNTLYATKDLALARHKFGAFQVDRSIYVVAAEQNLHFRQVFKALEKMGFEKAKNCYHLSYGMVTLPEGKMSSRLGNTITFNQLREQMLQKLHENLQKYTADWTAEEISETARKLCVGAIKYGMISSDPVKDIVFEMDNWIAFEGNTGPYLMYSYARTRSILRKGAEAGLVPSTTSLGGLTIPEEHDLLRYLFDFNDAVLQSCENYRPSTLANHLFYMCKEFNRFYTAVSVLKAETPELAGARLALVKAFGDTLSYGLKLLGITPPERM